MVSDSLNGEEAKPPSSSEGGEDGSRAPRLPRWTRQEILVLIQGKRVAESKARRIRTAGGGGGGAAALGSSGQVEPKWASVSAYCRMHGVNRGPVQCRKRWSNLAGDYKKIKEWERQAKNEPFWSMRNDLRRERKLPGFFDKEVFDILDGAEAPPLQPPPAPPLPAPPEAGPMFDSRRGGSAEDGMFSDFEQDDAKEKEEEEEEPAGISGRKRKRVRDRDQEEEEEAEAESTTLLRVLDSNAKTLAAHLEAHNTQIQLDRDQRKSHSDSLVAVLNKLADALVRISEKL